MRRRGERDGSGGLSVGIGFALGGWLEIGLIHGDFLGRIWECIFMVQLSIRYVIEER